MASKHIKSGIAAGLSLALLVLSPGINSYQAVAQTFQGGNIKGAKSGAGARVSPAKIGGLSSPILGNTIKISPAGVSGVIPGFSAGPAVILDQAGRIPVDPVVTSAEVSFSKIGENGSGHEGAASEIESGTRQDISSGKGAVAQAAGNVRELQDSEPIKKLSGPKAERGGALTWLFDKFKRSGGKEQAVSGARSESAAGLSPAKEGGAVSGSEVPAPARQDLDAEQESKDPGFIALVARFFRNLPKKLSLKDFNRSEKAYIIGQAVFILAITVYLASLPLLVKAMTGDAALTGVARAVHYWVLGGASLFSGRIAQKLPMKKTLVGGSLARGLIFGSIGLLAMAAMGPGLWTPFLILVGANALVVSLTHLVDLDSGGAAKVFDSDKKIEKAGYIYDFMFYGMLLFVPALMGIPMDWMDANIAQGFGAGAGYAFFAGLMGLATYIYSKHVKVIREKVSAKIKISWGVVRKLFSTANGKIGAGLMGLAPAGYLLLGGFPGMFVGLALAAAGLLGILHWDTMKAIWGNQTVLSRAAMETWAYFVEDALFAVVLPTFAIDILMAGAFGNGLLLSAATGGALLASVLLLSRAQKIQKKIGTFKFLAALTVMASLAFIPSMALWTWPTLWAAVPSIMLMKFMAQPVRSRMRAMLQIAIKNDPNIEKHNENIFSLMTFTEVISAGAGGLMFAWIFQQSADPASALTLAFGSMAAMKVVTLALMGISVVYLAVLFWVKHQFKKPTMVVHPGKGETSMKVEEAVSLIAGAVAPGAVENVSAKLSEVEAAIKSLEAAGSAYDRGPPLGLLHETKSLISAGRREEAAEMAEKLQALMPGVEEALALVKLSANLERMGLPQYRDEIVEKVPEARPTVVLLAPASVYKLSMTQEGNRQSPGDVLLVLDPSWIVQETWLESGHNQLYVKKGVYFDENGFPVLVEYRTPREVGYFGNFYTMGANDRGDGVPLEKDLAAPMSSSVELEKITNDKLLTRLMLAAKGVAVPATAAFLMAAHPLLTQAKNIEKSGLVRAVEMPRGEGGREFIKASVETFLENYSGEEVVVKPSGPRFHSARGVKFFDRGDVEGIVGHVTELSNDPMMTVDGSVLIDGRISPPALYYQVGKDYDGKGPYVHIGSKRSLKILSKDDIPGATDKQKKDWNLRVLTARAPWGGAKTKGIFARAGTWGLPTTAEPADPEDAAGVVRLEDVIEALRTQHGLLKTGEETARFLKDLDEVGEKALMALDAHEKNIEPGPGAAVQAQTDYIGLDVVVELDDGRLIPKIIEINDHDSGGQWQLDLFYPESAGHGWRYWMATALQKARRQALRGKKIVLVGAGYESKRFTLERAKELGVEIVVIDKGLTGLDRLAYKGVKLLKKLGMPTFSGWAAALLSRAGFDLKEHWARDMVSEFIPILPSQYDGSINKAQDDILRRLKKIGGVDGVVTFWENDVPAAADIAAQLNRPFHSVQAAWTVRNKGKTRMVLEEKGLPTPRSRSFKDEAGFVEAVAKVGFPAVIKPAFGAEAMFVIRVDNAAEARSAYEKIRREMNPAADDIFNYGTQVILEQYLDGPEFDVDIVMQGGKAAYVSVTDNWPTREPSFLATGSNLPSRLAPSNVAAIKERFIAYARGLGLSDGVLHLEGRDTADGPMLIEANGRMGGHYVAGWNKAVSGRDFVEDSFMIAAGIPIGSLGPEGPLVHLTGEFLIPEASGRLATLDLREEGRNHPDFFDLDLFKSQGDAVRVPPDGNERVGMLVAKGATGEEASASLKEIKSHLDLKVSQD